MKWGIIGWARYDNSIGREEEGVIAPPVRESVVVSDQRERERSIVRIVINLSAATWRAHGDGDAFSVFSAPLLGFKVPIKG